MDPWLARLLDAWEGADNELYITMRVRVHTLNGDVLAWTYVLDAFEGGLPSAPATVARSATDAARPRTDG